MLAPNALSTICNDGDLQDLLSFVCERLYDWRYPMFRLFHLILCLSIASSTLVGTTAWLPGFAADPALRRKWKKLIQQGNQSEIHKDYNTASRAYQQALPMAETIGKGTPELIESLARLAVLYLLVGNDNEADWNYRRLMEKEWTDKTKIQGMQAAAAALDDLAETYERLGTQQNRVDFLLNSLKIRERLSNHHPAIVNSLLHLAKYYCDNKDLSKAIACQRRARLEAEKTPNFSAKKYGGIMTRLSLMYMTKEKFREAIATLDDLRTKAKTKPEMTEGQKSIVLRMMGRCYFALKDYEKSEDCLKLALKEDAPESKSKLFTYVRLADTYVKSGKRDKARECLENAEALAKRRNFNTRSRDLLRLKSILKN